METEKINESVKAPLENARLRAGIDDELYRAMLFTAMLFGVRPDGSGLQWFMDAIRKMGGRLREKGAELIKRDMRETMLFYIEKKIVESGQPYMKTINRYAREYFGIESHRWLRLDQLAELLWTIQKEIQNS